MKRRIWCLGTGMGTAAGLTSEVKACVQECDVIIGAARMAALFCDMGKPMLEEYRPERIRAFLEEHVEYQNCAVVFSGDTGFYSGAKRLCEVLGEAGMEVCLLPGVSSVSYLAAKLGTSWEDARILSLHGRQANAVAAITENAKTFLILGKDGPERLCGWIHEYGLTEITLHIGSRLSYPDERILSRRGYEARLEDFGELCTVMIENEKPRNNQGRHLADQELIRGNVPMTKEEVRAVSLSKLCLTEEAVLYDIGAGTGSVSVEAALKSEKIRVYAIEKDPEGIELIRQNRRKFCTDWVEVVAGSAPEALQDLETPTHVFIGGSGGRLKEILRMVLRKNPEVRTVINAISLETVQEVMEAVKEGLLKEPEIVQITVAKSRKLGNYHMMGGQNPVYIISAWDGKQQGRR